MGALTRGTLLIVGVAVAGCDLQRGYELFNPKTGQHTMCLAWANSIFDAGTTTNPAPFRNCISACKAHGFVSVSALDEMVDTGRGDDTFVPPECT
jgi:hypothetical protein